MWIDAIGQTHAVCTAPARIVSLVPSLTELVCDLGLAHWLVGRTGFCIHPANAVAHIPKIGGTKDVNIEKIRKLAATHVLVNIDENNKPAVDALAEFVPHVIVTHPLQPRDNPDLYRLLGGVFQAQDKAAQLCAAFESACAHVHPVLPQRVLYCIWQDPWMTVSRDTYIAAMLRLIGWECWQAPESGKRYPAFSWNAALLDEIDLILLSSEPYRFTAAHVDALEKQTGKAVMLVDGEMLSWYGSRAIAGLGYLQTLARG